MFSGQPASHRAQDLSDDCSFLKVSLFLLLIVCLSVSLGYIKSNSCSEKIDETIIFWSTERDYEYLIGNEAF